MNDTKNALRSMQLGMLIGALLIVSRFLGGFTERAVGSVNTVLIVVILCLNVHLVRRVSSIRQAHVWDSRITLAFAAAALFNLLTAGVQIIFGAAFLSSFAFSAVTVLLSLPVFLSLMTLYLSSLFPELRSPRALSRAALITAGVYVLLRMANDVVLPLISYLSRKIINPRILSLTAWNTNISLLTLAFVLAAFLTLYAEIKNAPASGPDGKNGENGENGDLTSEEEDEENTEDELQGPEA